MHIVFVTLTDSFGVITDSWSSLTWNDKFEFLDICYAIASATSYCRSYFCQYQWADHQKLEDQKIVRNLQKTWEERW